MTLFETDIIRLRAFRRQDLDFLIELETDEEVMKTTGIGRALSVEQIEEGLKNLVEVDAQPPRVFLAELASDSSPVAWMMLIPTTFDGPELGFMLPRRLWGKGLGTQAAIATIRYGFEAQNLSQIYASTSPTNAASQRVLIKSGMRTHSISQRGEGTKAIELHVFVIDQPDSSKR